ncbi:MAG: hypothetical protein JWL59_4080 [Chthoniobacteraceae bacterium]|nr:hypothetical protein [Chthoniobacteraceae bacterium]
MSGFFSRLALPLLAKELGERAVRKRTYIMRVVFAGLLIGAFGVLVNEFSTRSYGPLSVLGSGRWLFQGLLGFQMAGIFLFLPAMTAGQLTLEKERDSLVLLFLTRLGPWQIVLEKYVSALIPIFSLLLVAMPMTAIAYAYGGVTQAAVGAGIYVLVLAALQVAALSLMCSAWCKTTVNAFLATYFLGALIYSGPVLLCGIVEKFIYSNSDCREWALRLFPMTLLEAGGIQQSRPPSLFLQSVPIWVSIVIFLGLTRLFLVRRAFLKGTNQALILFRWVDRFMHHLNRRAGNISVGNAEESLPGAHPIAWREMRRNVLARAHYLVRILLLVEIPTVYFGLSVMMTGSSSDMPVLVAFLGALATLAISVNAANAFVSERVQQTLDVLLTTPMSAREIVEEKARAMRRFLYVAAVPLLTLFFMEWGMKQPGGFSWHRPGARENPLLYLICSILTVAVYLPLVSWLSLWIGLKARTRFRAIITALVVIVLWCMVPLLFVVLVATRTSDEFENGWAWFMGLSPLFVPILNETSTLHQLGARSEWLVVAGNFVFHGGVLYFIRRRCLGGADLYLRRG